MITERTTCRMSGKEDFIHLFNLGNLFLSNFISKEQWLVGRDDLPRAPIQLVMGEESKCVQLRHTVDRPVLYDQYWYRSGINKTVTEDLRSIVEYVERTVELKSGDVVLDIACNDGTLLQQYRRPVYKIGFDPCKNIPCVGAHCFVNDLFDAEKFLPIRGKAKAITAAAVLYHVDDPVKFMRDVKECLTDDGIFVVQVSYLPALLKNLAFDTIAGHEHLMHLSLGAMKYLFDKTGFVITDIALGDMNCGTIRVTCMKVESGVKQSDKVNMQLLIEEQIGVNDPETYRTFFNECAVETEKLINYLRELRKQDKKIFIYGASTKGNAFLQCTGIDHNLVDAAVERDPKKIGLYTAGSWINIISEEVMRTNPPHALLVLPWHFLKEFVERERTFLENGGEMIFPLPKMRVITKVDLK